MDAWDNARQENGHMPNSRGVRPGAERPRRRVMPSDDGLAVAARPRERQAKAAGKRPMAWDRDPGVRAHRLGVDAYSTASWCRRCTLWIRKPEGGGVEGYPVCQGRARTTPRQAPHKVVLRID